MNSNGLKAVDFFCSGGGETCGFIRAGINVIGGIDMDPNCKETYEENNHSKFLNADAFNKAQRIMDLAFSQSIRVGIIFPSLY
jgi:site-specific DNA-cytosine methylase